ncbi:MAG: hypothetical protein ABWY26_11980 [Microbacterium sp.]
MTLTLDTATACTPVLSRMLDVRLVPAAPALWRIVDRGGRVIGHLQAVAQSEGMRYSARRFHAPSRAFRDLGEFWSVDDAVECVAFAR